jgi:23S rRNA (cytosine1962-C5)-methyltransferase
MLRRLPELLVKHGEVLAAVSAPELGLAFLRRQIETDLPGTEILNHLTAGNDFPEQNPDKGLHLLHIRLA